MPPPTSRGRSRRNDRQPTKKSDQKEIFVEQSTTQKRDSQNYNDKKKNNELDFENLKLYDQNDLLFVDLNKFLNNFVINKLLIKLSILKILNYYI